jgi:hypothetical protein
MFRNYKTNSLKTLSLVVLSILLLTTVAPRVFALSHSSNVAYVTESGTWDGAAGVKGVFNWAVSTSCTGSASTCTMTTTGGNTVTFTYVDVTTVDANPTTAFNGYDTVFVYEVCDIGSTANANLMSAINTFLTNGGKVVIYDGDWCAAGDGGAPNYSTFLFPFTSSNPGPQGSVQTPTFIEAENTPAVLTRGLSTTTTSDTDAIGDSNTFTTFNGAWCAAEEGPNANGVTGIQIGYARTGAGGLVIYNGNDNAFTFGPNEWDTATFNNAMDQPFNPDSLPCGRVASGITLTPSTATNPVGTTHTVTATVLDNTGAPIAGITVTFAVTSGPNTGTTGTGTSPTNAAGQASFTYSDTGGAGTDTIVASFHDSTGALHTSNSVTKIWTSATSAPEFPLGSLAMIAILVPAMLLLRRRIIANPIAS